MAIVCTRAPTTSRSLLFLLAAAILCGAVPSAHAQYYYAPSRDYYHNDTAEGTVLGGAFGAITGAVIGGRKKRGEGALIGAGVGAVTGNVLGRSKDRSDEYHASAGAAAVAHANRQAAAQAVTNFDLIRLTQAGVGEELIIGTIRARGARLDLSPEGLIALKESGVSDRVLIAAQELTRGYAPVPPPATTTIVTERAPSTVIVTPHPRWMYRYPPPYQHHRHHGARMHYRFRF